MKKRIIYILFATALLWNTTSMQARYAIGQNSPIKIGPNPCEDILNIDIEDAVHTISYITITDLLGKKVFALDINEQDADKRIRLNVTNMKSGVYFVTIYSQEGIVEVRKIFKK